MSKSGMFRFCMCNETAVETGPDVPQSAHEDATESTDDGGASVSFAKIAPARDSSEIKVSFKDSGDDGSEVTECDAHKHCDSIECSNELYRQSPETTIVPSKTVTFQTAVVEGAPASDVGRGTSIAKQSKQKSDIKVLHNRVRTKRVALRKIHAKLKIDLNEMQKMRDVLNSSKCAAAANLPDVITAESNCSEGDFMRKFRQLFDNAQTDISEPTKELEALTEEYAVLLEKSKPESDLSDEAAISSQVEGESQRLVVDGQRLLGMLRKAMKIAAVEYKLKLVFFDQVASTKQNLCDLEGALLELQQLKSNEGLGFEPGPSEGSETPSCRSIRNTFSQLFPRERTLKLEKKSKLKLAELHMAELENQQRQNASKARLLQAIESQHEDEIRIAVEEALKTGIDESDVSIKDAKDALGRISDEVKKCLTSLRKAVELSSMKDIEKYMKIAQALKISDADPLLSRAASIAQDLKEKEEKRNSRLSELRNAMRNKDADEIQRLLLDIKSMKLTTDAILVEEATTLLTYLQKYHQELKKNAMESVRIRLVTSLESDSPQDISETLHRAQTAGLSNCVEIMGAKTKLVQLQSDNQRYKDEIKKIENYLDKLASRAIDNKATADLIMTLERAIAVAESLDVSPEVKQRARGALHVLESRKEKVKNVKDELQRAVMECRHEAITCAIAEAESLPYFLTFDPLDGQISAILEYAKNKISPHENKSVPGDESNSAAIRRVKSNLKRAMRGNCSGKLASALSLYRKTMDNENGQGDSTQGSTENEQRVNLVRRAERKYRRLKKQEKLEKKEWIKILETMRENLKAAMKENDRAELWKAVYQFKRELGSSMGKEDENLLRNARKQLREVTIQQFKSNLSSALNDRDPTRLRHSLVELDSPSLAMFPMTIEGKFKDDIEKARKLLGRLKDMEKIKKAVSEMSRSQLAEIHRYPNPPACVRAVMTATYILLGENEKDLKDWTAVLRLLAKMGREALTRRVAICSPSHVPITTARRVREILSGLSQSQVQDVNKGAAVFFAWASCVVTEVFDRHEDDPNAVILPKPSGPPGKPRKPPTDPLKSEFWNRLSRPRSSIPVRSMRTVKMNPRPTSAMK